MCRVLQLLLACCPLPSRFSSATAATCGGVTDFALASKFGTVMCFVGLALPTPPPHSDIRYIFTGLIIHHFCTSLSCLKLAMIMQQIMRCLTTSAQTQSGLL